MKNSAYLIGISQYPDHHLKGVSNDLHLIAQALRHRNWPKAAINIFEDIHTTLTGLHTLFTQIRDEFEDVERGTCFVHIGASGVLSLEPLRGGILATNGDALNFDTAFPFDALTDYLPVRLGIHVTTVLDV
jgi:hypothetical protein